MLVHDPHWCGPYSSGSAFGRTDLLRIFIFEPPDFFADFCDRFLLWAKRPQKNLAGIRWQNDRLKEIQQNPQHISAHWPGQSSRFEGHRGGEKSE